MFVAHYENTMRNARPKLFEPQPVVRTIQQIRVEKRLEAEEKRLKEIAAWRAKVEEERQRQAVELRNLEAVEAYRCIDVLEVKTPARTIIARVAALHDMTVAEIMSNRRDRLVVEARFDAIKAVADARPDLSLPQIGRIFAGRDHTSILYALKMRGGRRNPA